MSRLFIGVQPARMIFRHISRTAKPNGPLSVVSDRFLGAMPHPVPLPVLAFGSAFLYLHKLRCAHLQLLVLVTLISAAVAAIRARIMHHVKACSQCHGYGIAR